MQDGSGNRPIKTDGGINISLNIPPNTPPSLSAPEMIRVEPQETPLLTKIEPTASFAIDLFQNVEVYPSITSPCLVHFRPSGNWKKEKGEYCYGFDWLRIGDSGDWDDKKAVDDHYANLIGRYYEIGTNNLCDDWNNWKMRSGRPCEFSHEPEAYKRYLKSTFPKAFFVILKSHNPSICTNSKIPNEVKKLIDRSECYYTVPIMLLNALGSAKIKIKLELLMPKNKKMLPKAIVFREHTQGNGAFTITPVRVEPKTKWQEITITSTRVINQFELIDAFAVYDDPANPGTDRELFSGQLRVHPNNNIRDLNILFVKTNIFKGATKISTAKDFLNTKEKDLIQKIAEGQLLTNLNIEYYPDLDVMGIHGTDNVDNYTNDTKTVIAKMTDILTAVFNADLATVATNAVPGTPESNPARYNNYSVVFLVDLDARVPPSTNMLTRHASIYSKTVGVNEGEVGERLKETVMHEILHTLGLYHTFNPRGIATYRARDTANIMDYSHVTDDQKRSTGLSRYFLWLWQIKHIWNVLDRAGANNGAIGIPQEYSNLIPANNQPHNITQFISAPRI